MNQYVLKRYSIGKHVSLPLEKSEYDPRDHGFAR
jgi:hypothetical protein